MLLFVCLKYFTNDNKHYLELGNVGFTYIFLLVNISNRIQEYKIDFSKYNDLLYYDKNVKYFEKDKKETEKLNVEINEFKNEEALNCGFENKIRIYKGQDENGNNKSGITSFEFTRTIIEYYDAGNKTWDIEQILERKKYLMTKIEKMLNISREDINLKISDESESGKTGKSKWLYKNVYYDNAKLVRSLIQDYIFDNKITKYGDIPSEIRDFKMHSHELIVEENNPIIKDYSYSEVESNGIKVFVRSICKEDNTNAFLEVLKKYYDYSLEFVDTNE